MTDAEGSLYSASASRQDPPSRDEVYIGLLARLQCAGHYIQGQSTCTRATPVNMSAVESPECGPYSGNGVKCMWRGDSSLYASLADRVR
jgi:hypothetical protein